MIGSSPSTLSGMTSQVVLVGLMGAGKSSVGRVLADRLGRAFVDVDEAIVARTGASVPEVFRAQGEEGFRAIEAATVADLLADPQPRVLAAGGGAVVTAAVRDRLRSPDVAVVWLDAPPDELLRRVGHDPGRPMLGADPGAALQRLHGERAPWYREVADVVVDAGTGLTEQVAERVVAALRADGRVQVPADRSSVQVELGDRSYPVIVGSGVLDEVAAVLPPGTRRVAVVTQSGVREAGILVDPGVPHTVHEVAEGEDAKTFATVEELCRSWAAAGMSRADAVVAVGGGVVTDVAGFAAAVYHRGIPVVHVATTLLGQVDAAIGGKTGVNLPEGKNLVGAFWQPSAVLCDVGVLASLPVREYRSGMGELAKYHFLGGGALDRMPLPQRVAAAAGIKAEVVSGDEREGGRRAILNYGHTLAHALEIAGGFDLRHGEAVAIGLVFAAELGRVLGRIDDVRVAEHRRVVAAYGLPGALPRGSDRDELVRLMARDKKALAGITFVLDGPDGVVPVTDIPRAALDAAFDATEEA